LPILSRLPATLYARFERRAPDVVYTPRIWRYVMSGVEQIPEGIFKRLSF
jgi:hypothetical protein